MCMKAAMYHAPLNFLIYAMHSDRLTHNFKNHNILKALCNNDSPSTICIPFLHLQYLVDKRVSHYNYHKHLKMTSNMGKNRFLLIFADFRPKLSFSAFTTKVIIKSL